MPISEATLDEVERALEEATEWNWLDDDAPVDTRERIEAALTRLREERKTDG